MAKTGNQQIKCKKSNFNSFFSLFASVLVFALLQLAKAQPSKYLLDFTCVIIVIIIITITKLSILVGYQLP